MSDSLRAISISIINMSNNIRGSQLKCPTSGRVPDLVDVELGPFSSKAKRKRGLLASTGCGEKQSCCPVMSWMLNAGRYMSQSLAFRG